MHINTWPVDAQTRLVGGLGYPIGHTFSPILHNAAFFAQGLNLRYVALDVPPALLPEAVKGLRALGFAGANVTIPHKQSVMPFLDHVSPRARAIGAVNTIVCRRTNTTTTLEGTNTDVEGFLAPLLSHAASLLGKSAVILGAGGAARAVAYALMGNFSLRAIFVAARRLGRARVLCTDLAPWSSAGVLHPVPLPEAGSHIRAASLVVNATSVGMHPRATETPWPDTRSFREGQVVYDLVYRPATTRLMADALSCGATAIGGMAMFLGQASEAYSRWTGKSMPLEAVRSVLPEA